MISAHYVILVMMKVDLTPIYVLHTRPFRNTSLIVELFSKTYGRIAVVAKSARGPSSRFRGQLQLFTPILASWLGAHELKTLTQIELNGMPIQLNHDALFFGFYFNELLTRLLHKEDPHPKLFDYYHESLCQLENSTAPRILRLFEKKLLEELGYGLPLTHEAKTREKIAPDRYYRFAANQGFLLSDEKTPYSGADLLCIAAENFAEDSVLRTAKQLMRLVLSQLLGNIPLHSRALF